MRLRNAPVRAGRGYQRFRRPVRIGERPCVRGTWVDNSLAEVAVIRERPCARGTWRQSASKTPAIPGTPLCARDVGRRRADPGALPRERPGAHGMWHVGSALPTRANGTPLRTRDVGRRSPLQPVAAKNAPVHAGCGAPSSRSATVSVERSCAHGRWRPPRRGRSTPRRNACAHGRWCARLAAERADTGGTAAKASGAAAYTQSRLRRRRGQPCRQSRSQRSADALRPHVAPAAPPR